MERDLTRRGGAERNKWNRDLVESRHQIEAQKLKERQHVIASAREGTSSVRTEGLKLNDTMLFWFEARRANRGALRLANQKINRTAGVSPPTNADARS